MVNAPYFVLLCQKLDHTEDSQASMSCTYAYEAKFNFKAGWAGMVGSLKFKSRKGKEISTLRRKIVYIIWDPRTNTDFIVQYYR